MLEKIISSIQKPLRITSAGLMLYSLLPSKSYANYISFFKKDGKEYIVEIDDRKNLVQINADNEKIANKLGKEALINKKTEELERHTQDLAYEILDVFRNKIKGAKTISGKINLITKLFNIKDAKVPWWPFALDNPKDFKIKMLAAEEAWNYRADSLELIKRLKYKTNLDSKYEDICIMDYKIQKTADYISNINKAPGILPTGEELNFLFEELWKTFNLKKLEQRIDDLSERYKIKNKEVEDLQAEMKKSLEESREYKEYKESIEKINLEELIKKYDIILDPAKVIFYKNYNIPLLTSADIRMQTPQDQEKANLTLKVEKSSQKNDNYNLRVWVLSDKFINKTKTDIAILYPKEATIGKISQKAYNFRIKENKPVNGWEEIVLYGQGKSIILESEITDFAFDKMIRKTMRGNIIKINNILSWLGEKLYNLELKENKEDLERLLAQCNEKYSAKQIKINPAKEFRQTSGYLFLIPVDNSSNKNILLNMDIALESGTQVTEKGYGAPSGYENASAVLEDITIKLGKKLPKRVWIVPDSWIKKEGYKIEILKPLIRGNKIINPYDGVPEFGIIGEDIQESYIFMDEEDIDKSFAEKGAGMGYFPCFTSPNISEQIWKEIKSPEDLNGLEELEGIYFGGGGS